MNIQILKNKIKEDKLLNNISSFFDNEVYIIGGAVRDYLLDKATIDRDLIVVDEDAREFSLKLAEFLDGKFIALDELNKIYRVVLPDKENFFDITNPVGGSLEKDILRRDLTINSIAVNIKTGEVIDLCNGVSDIESGVIRGISDKNFAEDPLRLLRVFRFQAILGFVIDENTLLTVEKYKNLVSSPAKERIVYELMKLFSGSFAHLALLKMDECGVLNKIFPFVDELKQVPPNLHHHLDLFNHCIETVRQVGVLYEKSNTEVKAHMDSVDFGGFSRLAHLRFAAFLHDLGKFSTWTVEPDTGRHRFIKHDEVGANIAKTLLKSMGFSNKQVEYLTLMIKKHMYPTAVVSSPELSDKVKMRFVRKIGENAIDNILIAQADRLSARGPEITEEIVNENISLLNSLLNFYLSARETLTPLPKLLDGYEVMQLLNIKPSAQLGRIMTALREAQISGDIVTKEDAKNFIQTLL